MLRKGTLALAAALASAGTLTLAACGTDATNVDGCRKIEEARCRRAQACGVDLEHIKHVGTSADDALSGCIRYYHEACLHGTVTTQDPGPTAVQSCVDAVTSGTCDVVKAPETTNACAWMIPPAQTTTDAGTTATDAAADGT